MSKRENNLRRSSYACDALAAHNTYLETGETTEENIIDLLTDLRHWCRHYGVDFQKCVEMSEIHYEDER